MSGWAHARVCVCVWLGEESRNIEIAILPLYIGVNDVHPRESRGIFEPADESI